MEKQNKQADKARQRLVNQRRHLRSLNEVVLRQQREIDYLRSTRNEAIARRDILIAELNGALAVAKARKRSLAELIFGGDF